MLKKYWKNEDGSVAAEWVLVVASSVSLAIAVVATIGAGTTEHGDKLTTYIQEVEIVDHSGI